MIFNGCWKYDNGKPSLDNGMYGTPFNIKSMRNIIPPFNDENWVLLDKLLHAYARSNYPQRLDIMRIDNEGFFVMGGNQFGRLNIVDFDFVGTEVILKKDSRLAKMIR